MILNKMLSLTTLISLSLSMLTSCKKEGGSNVNILGNIQPNSVTNVGD